MITTNRMFFVKNLRNIITEQREEAGRKNTASSSKKVKKLVADLSTRANHLELPMENAVAG